MIVLYALTGILFLGLLGAGLASLARRPGRAGRTTPGPGDLMTQDADRINVRSADNVRLLSDDQLSAVEKSLDEDT